MPSRLADDREVKAIAATVGAAGRGTLMLVKGSKTSIDWIEDLAVESKRPVLVSALRHHPASPNKVFEDLAALRDERERGRRLSRSEERRVGTACGSTGRVRGTPRH